MTAPLVFDEDAIRADFAAGYTHRQLAERHGVNREAIRQKLIRMGLEAPRVGEAPRVRVTEQSGDRVTIVLAHPNDMGTQLLRHRITLPRISMHIAQLEDRPS